MMPEGLILGLPEQQVLDRDDGGDGDDGDDGDGKLLIVM